jgi:hypothetical protein
MNSKIIDLKNEIKEEKISTSVILNKALEVALRLNQNDFADWIRKEKTGYKDRTVKIPDYRFVYGNLIYKTPFSSWDNLDFNYISFEDEEKYTNIPLNEGVDLLESFVINYYKNYSTIKAPKYLEQKISKSKGLDIELRFKFATYQINAVLKKINNVVYEWLINLETNGIIGENNAFSESEIAKAKNIYNIFNFYNNVTKSQFNVDSDDNTQSN